MSSNYSPLEKSIASLISRFPKLKVFSKQLYTRLNFLFYKKDYAKKTENELTFFHYSGYEGFFGYYDNSPQNTHGHVLCHFSELATHQKPNLSYSIQIALFDPENYSQPQYTVSTKAYNWQQGSRTQWLNDKLFIFNDYDESKKRYISKVYSVEGKKEIKHFPFPVQDAHLTNYYLSLNYRRLQALRPDYGYRNLPPLNNEELQNLDNDGIWYIDYKSGEGHLLFSLKEIVNTQHEAEFDNAIHYVNHIMISPDGDSFIFLHRYFINNQRFDRLMHLNLDNKNVSVLANNGMVSHCCWIDDETVLGYLIGPENEAGYYTIDVNTSEHKNFAGGKLDHLGDGHPNASNGWFVSDTYPDKSRMQNLMLSNLASGKTNKIGEFFHGLKFHDETRCDLHPRFSPDGKRIFIDTVYSGKRQLLSIAVSNSIQ